MCRSTLWQGELVFAMLTNKRCCLLHPLFPSISSLGWSYDYNCILASLLSRLSLQAAPWHSMGEQMGWEQGEGPPMHHPHLPLHGVIAAGKGKYTANVAILRSRLAQLQRKCAQQQEVRHLVTCVSNLC